MYLKYAIVIHVDKIEHMIISEKMFLQGYSTSLAIIKYMYSVIHKIPSKVPIKKS